MTTEVKESKKNDFVMGQFSSVSDRPVSLSAPATTQKQGGQDEPQQDVKPTDKPESKKVDEGVQAEDDTNIREGLKNPANFVKADAEFMPDTDSGQKACPFCTFLNDSYSTTCMICQGALE